MKIYLSLPRRFNILLSKWFSGMTTHVRYGYRADVEAWVHCSHAAATGEARIDCPHCRAARLPPV
ncbi:MAG: hypothetical protein JO171_15175 [Paludibacterium sp.]|uniref:hypothetical protein n=1 Tax=Paludibacterium sp. TaxID=1917523 RepID=UPI0025DEFBF9|nr:hypothetical protein [Paludibacterium sp.]MBV8048494.1 hypothetical protein [Paludibacterium sp.]MBV8647354.1 hypothetical protein [Paludibacterium sp.]